jgi:hypothetical protein
MVGCWPVALNAVVVALATSYREFRRFGPRRRLGGSEKGHEISFLRTNSLRILTGEFFATYRELNRAIREIFTLIRESRSRRYFGASCPADNPIVPTDLEPCREGKQGAAKCSKSPKPISSTALSIPRRAANRSPSASTRTIGRSGLHDGGVGRVARARVHRAHRRGGPRDAMGRAAR